VAMTFLGDIDPRPNLLLIGRMTFMQQIESYYQLDHMASLRVAIGVQNANECPKWFTPDIRHLSKISHSKVNL